MSVQEVSYFGDVNPGSKMEDWQLWKYSTSTFIVSEANRAPFSIFIIID
jgi:hypothetical protein